MLDENIRLAYTVCSTSNKIQIVKSDNLYFIIAVAPVIPSHRRT